MGQAIFYFFLGIVFIIIAINNAKSSGTIWNIPTVLLTSIAAIDFGMGIRLLKMHSRNKQQK